MLPKVSASLSTLISFYIYAVQFAPASRCSSRAFAIFSDSSHCRFAPASQLLIAGIRPISADINSTACEQAPAVDLYLPMHCSLLSRISYHIVFTVANILSDKMSRCFDAPALILVLVNNDYSLTTSLGYTETCFLSLPLRSKRTTPSALAYSVSSLPIPTLIPG